jgi:hypothetical protein
MTLRLTFGRRRLEMDSSLEGFDDVVSAAAAAARARDLDLDPATRANFQSAGHLLDHELTPRDIPLPFGRRRVRAAPGSPPAEDGAP